MQEWKLCDVSSDFLNLPGVRLSHALRDLAFRGLASADSWMALVGLIPDLSETPIAPESRRADGGFRSMSGRSSGRRRGGGAGSGAARDAARRVREATLALPPEARWSLTTRFALMGPDVDDGARARARASALLERYGVVSRQTITLEGSDWAWGPIVSALSLMELRGSARRGYFVAGLPGLQFAMPSAVEDLRGAGSPGSRGPIVMSLRDPAYVMDRTLAGAVDDSDTEALLVSARRPGSYVVLSGGEPVLLAEENGARLTATTESRSRRRVPAAIKAFRDMRMASAGMRARVVVREWNDTPVLESEGRKVLLAAGFREDYPGMTYDALAARSIR